jgi:hypothetical protein
LQESKRKMIECTFGILQKKFLYIAHPCRLQSVEAAKTVFLCCVVLHNMVVEERIALNLEVENMGEEDDSPSLSTSVDAPITAGSSSSSSITIGDDTNEMIFQYENELKIIKDHKRHLELRKDLIAHFWSLNGGESV